MVVADDADAAPTAAPGIAEAVPRPMKRKAVAPLPFACRTVAAPMVGASDLPFRLLCRRHGVELAYTEMLIAERVVGEPEYRERKLRTCEADHPLVVQLCGTDARTLGAAAAAAVSGGADAVCLNLGCPLPAAREHGFGAYLVESPDGWAHAASLIQAMARAVPSGVPIVAKVRLRRTVEESVDLCRALQAAGCAMVAVHARTLPAPGEHRADRLRPADLDAVRAIVRALDVPVLCNGATRFACDVERNLRATGAAGLMSAEGLLSNPLLFEGGADLGSGGADLGSGDADLGWGDADEETMLARTPSLASLGGAALEYLELAERYPPPAFSVARSHIMWMLGRSGKGHRCEFPPRVLGPWSSAQLRLALAEAEGVDALRDIVRSTLLWEGGGGS